MHTGTIYLLILLSILDLILLNADTYYSINRASPAPRNISYPTATAHVIIPVPLHLKKIKKRGFNQSEKIIR